MFASTVVKRTFFDIIKYVTLILGTFVLYYQYVMLDFCTYYKIFIHPRLIFLIRFSREVIILHRFFLSKARHQAPSDLWNSINKLLLFVFYEHPISVNYIISLPVRSSVKGARCVASRLPVKSLISQLNVNIFRKFYQFYTFSRFPCSEFWVKCNECL